MNNDPQEPKLLEHDADGIRELDNLLPRWWVWLFYLTVAFGVIYLLYYHVLRVGDLQATEFDKEWQRGEAIKSNSVASFESALGELKPSADKTVLADGQKIYLTYCAACHRADGGGLVGPNLTDDYWIHGSNYVDSMKIIINGVPAKGMLTWRGVLKPGQIESVASYIYTLRGTHPPNPKPPENQSPAAPAANQFE